MAETERVRIEVDPDAAGEIVIRVPEVTEDTLRLKEALNRVAAGWESGRILLRLGGSEYLVDVRKILYFETEDGKTAAHTAKNIYYSGQKLYELEESLPPYFMRVSKAVILNLAAVSVMNRELTGICRVGFAGCGKQTYVSRMYYKVFREKLNEMWGVENEKKQ